MVCIVEYRYKSGLERFSEGRIVLRCVNRRILLYVHDGMSEVPGPKRRTELTYKTSLRVNRS